MRSVFPPILPKLAGSPMFATPLIIETKTNGTAINFKRLIKMVPKGAIQSKVKALHPIVLDRSAQIIPKTSPIRSEEHTSELQSRPHLVCRLLLEKKK